MMMMMMMMMIRMMITMIIIQQQVFLSFCRTIVVDFVSLDLLSAVLMCCSVRALRVFYHLSLYILPTEKKKKTTCVYFRCPLDSAGTTCGTLRPARWWTTPITCVGPLTPGATSFQTVCSPSLARFQYSTVIHERETPQLV